MINSHRTGFFYGRAARQLVLLQPKSANQDDDTDQHNLPDQYAVQDRFLRIARLAGHDIGFLRIQGKRCPEYSHTYHVNPQDMDWVDRLNGRQCTGKDNPGQDCLCSQAKNDINPFAK